MSMPTLRGLAKAYNDGLIDRKQYLRARRQIIDDVVSGAIDIVAYESPTSAGTPDFDRTFSDPESTLELAHLSVAENTIPNSSAKSKWPIIIAAVLGLAVLGGAAWFKLSGSPDPERIEVAVGAHAVVWDFQPGHHRAVRWQGGRYRGDGVVEYGTLRGQRVDRRGWRRRIAVATEVVGASRIERDKKKIPVFEIAGAELTLKTGK